MLSGGQEEIKNKDDNLKEKKILFNKLKLFPNLITKKEKDYINYHTNFYKNLSNIIYPNVMNFRIRMYKLNKRKYLQDKNNDNNNINNDNNNNENYKIFKLKKIKKNYSQKFKISNYNYQINQLNKFNVDKMKI